MTNEGTGGGFHGTGCDEILDLVSLRPTGALSPDAAARLDHHLEGCSACAREAAFAARVYEARPEPPPGLADAVLREAWGRRGRARPAPGWMSTSLAAAAVLVLSLGIGLATRTVGPGEGGLLLSSALETPAPEWGAEEWLVAGAPVLEGISDEALLLLLDEVDS
jgi:hypothetical protein